MQISDRVLKAAVILGALVLTFLAGRSSAPPTTDYTYKVVDPGAILAREPRIVTRTVDRIVYRTVEPVSVATAPEGGEGTISAFCAQLVREASEGLVRPVGRRVGDTSPPGSEPVPVDVPEAPAPEALPTIQLMRSIELDPPLFWGKTKLNVFHVGSDASLTDSEFRVAGNTQIVAHEQITVRHSRWWWAENLVRLGVPLFAGYVIGAAR